MKKFKKKPKKKKEFKNISSLGTKLSLVTMSLFSTNLNAKQNEKNLYKQNSQFKGEITKIDNNYNKWKYKAALSLYKETDYITVFEALLSGTKKLNEKENFNFKLTADTITGSSPNGTIKSDGNLILTSASGGQHGIKTSHSSDFEDTRFSLFLNWQKKLSKLSNISLGTNISSESDYFSLGFNSNFSTEFNERNTTLFLGLAFNNDTVKPENGFPQGLSIKENNNINNETGNKTKKTMDFLIGFSQLINKNSFFQINYSLGNSSGYHTDPYKFLSIVDENTGKFLTSPIDKNTGKVLKNLTAREEDLAAKLLKLFMKIDQIQE